MKIKSYAEFKHFLKETPYAKEWEPHHWYLSVLFFDWITSKNYHPNY